MKHQTEVDQSSCGSLHGVIAAEAGERLARLLRGLDPADAECVRENLRPSIANRVRQAERNAAIRRAAWFWRDEPPTRRAASLATALRRYAAAGWRRERERGRPAQPFAATLFDVLTLNNGRPLGHRMIFAICSETPGQLHLERATAGGS